MEYAGVPDETTRLSDEVCMRTPPPLLKAGAGSIGIECESAVNEDGTFTASHGDTQIFIYPPYKFKAVDALITNFHLPESTLIMLVSAFCGREQTLAFYREAVNEKYRFFSFGDACLLL